VLRDQQEGELTRKVNGGYLTTAIVLLLVGGAICFGLWNWALAASGTPWGVVANVVLVLFAVTTALFVGVGFSMIFKPAKAK
jgi:hypothetical protein